jgi:two-component system invasion response regulator UvrY
MKVLIADDHAVVRRGVMETLAEAFPSAQFGQAANAGEILDAARREPWDLVLLDLSLPGRNGLEVLAELRREHPRLPVIILTMAPESEYARRAFKAGAAGFVSKQSAPEELVAAVRKVAAGGRYLTASLAETLAAELARDEDTPHDRLSEREFEVMRRLALGESVKAIAAALCLSEKTVFTYRARVLEKLGLQSDVEIARYALKQGLVE